MRLVLTRPEHDAARTAQLLRAQGHDVLLVPLLEVETDRHAELGEGPWSALLMTSANAARALATHNRIADLRQLPVFVVGRRTAEAARSAGLHDVRSADGNAADLVRLAATQIPGARHPLLYVAGEDRARDLAAEFSGFGLTVKTVVIYRARAVLELPPPLRAALAGGRVDGVLHFSRRSADVYVARSAAAGVLDRALSPQHFCLSKEVAEPLVAAGAARIQVAARPDEATLVSSIC